MVLSNDLASIKTTEETKKVWKHHIEAWDASDLDGIMEDYCEDSIFIGNNKVYKGIEEIRGIFASLFKIFGDGRNLIYPEVIVEELIYISWNFTPKDDDNYFGTDSFVLENGIIKYQTVASLLYEKYQIG